MRALLLSVALATSCTNGAAQETKESDVELAALRDQTLQGSLAHEVACDLADRVGPRPAGSEGDRRAVEWAVARMNLIGLANVHTETVAVAHWERGLEQAEIVAPVKQRLSVAALGQSVAGTVEADLVRVTSLEDLAALPDDRVNGRIVFFDKPMARGVDGWRAYGEAVDVRAVGAASAAKKGAVASLIRSVATGRARFPHTGAQRTGDGIPPIPAGALAVPDAELVARLIAKGETVRVKLTLESTLGEAVSANVIGEVTGRETPDEIVVIGGHLDSWDLGTGAIDDGAGVGVALEVARILKSRPPRRTVRVVLFANEEHGLKGAFAYANAHRAELAKHQAALEIDGGTGRPLEFVWWGAESADPVMKRIGDALVPLGVPAAKRDARAGGADLIPLGPLGVTKIDFMQDATTYFDFHHSADDTCDKIVPADLAQVTAASAVAVWVLGETPALLERSPVPPED